MNFKMRFMTVAALFAAFALTAGAQENAPTMHITLDKAIELALSERGCQDRGLAELVAHSFTRRSSCVQRNGCGNEGGYGRRCCEGTENG